MKTANEPPTFLLINADERVLAAAETEFGGMLNGVDAVLPIDAVQEVCGIVLSRHLLLIDDVDAGLIESHWVGRGEDAVVFELHRRRMIHAVAVYRHVVHHTDIDDALLLLEVVHDGLGSCSHTLEESVLIADELSCPKLAHIEFLHLACRVDICLAVLTGTADREILQCTTVAAHGVTFEVVEGNHKVVVGHVSSHDVELDVRLIFHGDADLVVFVHDIHGEILREAVTLNHLPVVLRCVALVFLIGRSVAVCGITLHDSAVHLEHQVLYEFRLQVVRIAALSSTHLHGDAPLGRNTQGFIDFHQRLWADFPCQIHLRLCESCCRCHQHQCNDGQCLLHKRNMFSVF